MFVMIMNNQHCIMSKLTKSVIDLVYEYKSTGEKLQFTSSPEDDTSHCMRRLCRRPSQDNMFQFGAFLRMIAWHDKGYLWRFF